MKKKSLALLISVSMVLGLAACGSEAATEGEQAKEETEIETEEESRELVVYTTNSEGLVNTTIPLFEEKYGISVEVVHGSTGEMLDRIRSEKEEPEADVLFGGSWAARHENQDLWEPYVSPNDAVVIDAYKNRCGFITSYMLDGSVLLVNQGLIGDVEIKGYEDLLNPALKGKIAAADPTKSSSAFSHLTNILLAMGGYESEASWQYIRDLAANMEGRLCESSSEVYEKVVEGEAIVGLSYEDPCEQLVKVGTPVEVVYMEEGTVFLPASVTIVKNAKNMDNAKLFLDFLLSPEVQNLWGSTLTNRPIIDGATTNDFMTPMSDIYVLEEDIPYVSEHKQEILEKYSEIYDPYQSE